MSIGLLVRGNAPSLGAVVGAVGFAQGFALASQQGAGVVEHIVRPPLHPLVSRRAGPLRRETRPPFGWAEVPCSRVSCKLRAIHLVIERGFLPGVRFGSDPGRSLMKEAEKRQK
jgi:hypothetical protein